MSKFFALGATGLVGNAVLHTIEASKQYSVVTLTRRNLKEEFKDVESIVEKDSTKWGDIIKKTADLGENSVFFSGLGTTKKDAGSIENQYKIDYTLNYECAKAAKEAGFKTYVIVSSSMASSGSRFAYLKMKGELDDDVSKLGFERTIILRPGPLMGDREVPKTPVMNAILEQVRKVPYVNYYVTKGIYGKEIAAALEKILQKEGKGIEIFETQELLNLAK